MEIHIGARHLPRTSAAHATEMRQRILDGEHRAMLTGG